MAEASSLASRQSLFEMDGDTPLPAAEVLIDLKESARRRNNILLSPRKRKAYCNHSNDSVKQNHNNCKVRGDETSVWTSDGSDGGEVTDGGEETENFLSKRRKVSSLRNNHKKLESEGQPWSKQMKTFLRLPKALTWCHYEWFCSDIDRPFFSGSNDFCQCLEELFPRLKTRQLSHAQWHIIRRMIGKPRRCSAQFFAEERHILAERRRKVRELQCKIHQGMQLSAVDFNNYRELPDTLPAVLTLGTRVTAWLNNKKEKGFYIGTVEAVDLDKHQYWVTFDKPGVGKHSVNDYDIKSMYPTEVICLSSLEVTHANRQLLSSLPSSSSVSTATTTATVPHNNESSLHVQPTPEVSDPLLASLPASSKRTDPQQPSLSLGGFPTNFLRQVVQMSKLLSLKQDRLKKLSTLNTHAEKMHTRHSCLSPEFQKHYATVVIDLDDINRMFSFLDINDLINFVPLSKAFNRLKSKIRHQLNLRSEAIKKYSSELGYQDEPRPMSSVQECLEQAATITELSNVKLRSSGSEVTDKNVLNLITKLSSILLQVEMLSHDGCLHDLSDLQTTISEAASTINIENQRIFMKHIDKPLALIQSGMDPSESLHAFSVSTPTTKRPNRTSKQRGEMPST